MRLFIGTACLSLTAILTSACGGGSTATVSIATPDGAIETSVNALSQNDIGTLMNTTMPAAEFSKMEQEWDKQRQTPDPAELAEMNHQIQLLTAPGAEEQLFAMVQPQLEQAQQSLAMAPMMIGMALSQIGGADSEMSEEDQQQVQQLMTGMQSWISTVDLTDEGKIKQAIASICSAARETGITSAEQFHTLSLSDIFSKATPMVHSLKEVLATYGLDLQQALSSITLGDANIDGDTATVPFSMQLFGATIKRSIDMYKHNGSWFMKTAELPDAIAP